MAKTIADLVQQPNRLCLLRFWLVLETGFLVQVPVHTDRHDY